MCERACASLILPDLLSYGPLCLYAEVAKAAGRLFAYLEACMVDEVNEARDELVLGLEEDLTRWLGEEERVEALESAKDLLVVLDGRRSG